MRSLTFLGATVALVTCVACGGQSLRREADATAGAGASGQAGAGGKEPGGGGVGGVSGDRGDGGDVGDGGDGVPPSVPTVRPTPALGKAWTFRSVDPLNSSPPVLAPLGDGILIAGATTDPEQVGLEMFEGSTAEAFVALIDHEARFLWSTPLIASGMPGAVAVDSAGDIVVIAPYSVDFIGPAYGSDTTYLAKLSSSGEIVYERELDVLWTTVALAVGPEGDIYLGGEDPDYAVVDSSYVLLARYDADGNEVWQQRWHNTGSTAGVRSLAIDSNGNLNVTGDFNGTLTMGDVSLTTEASLGGFGMANGFFARLRPDGELVTSARFGGRLFDGGLGIVALSDGDLLIRGFLSGPSQIGGLAVEADHGGSGFLARLDAAGQTRWLALPGKGYAVALAADTDETPLYVAGHDDGVAWLAAYGPDGTEALSVPLPAEGIFFTRSLAVDSLHSLWLSGGFANRADFGNGNVLESDEAGVFLVRLDRE